MKTIEEFYKELAGSKELQEELNSLNEKLNSLNEKALGKFLRKHDCEGTAKEFTDFARSQEGEIQDDDAKAAAGGWAPSVPVTGYPPKAQGVV